MLQLDNVRLVYNAGSPSEVVALRHLDLTLPEGQFCTVVGSNGAGKSSLIQVVSGTVRPTEGRVRLAGRDVTRLPDHRRAAQVARVFDNPHAGTVPELSIEDNLALAMSRGRRRGLRAAVTARHRTVMRERLELLGLGLERRLGAPVRLLSAGQRQSVTMIMAALTAPRVLLLDEHLAALDPETQRRVLGLTVDIVGELGCTALMVTHNMQHAIATGERLLVMSRGRVLADLSGRDKTGLTVDALVARIVRGGDAVSDRLVLQDGL